LPVDRPGEQIAGVGAEPLRPAEPLELLALAELALMDVGAAGEGATATAQDRHVGVGVRVEAAERLVQGHDQLVAEGVELFRPVQGDGRDMVFASVLDEHAESPPVTTFTVRLVNGGYRLAAREVWR